LAYCGDMAEHQRLQGDLQVQIMSALWRIGEGTVEQVRTALPSRYRGAYNTVQTVLNRLAERGLLARQKHGQALVYTPKLTEAEYVSRSIESALAGASTEARQTALAHLIGGMDREQISELQRLARDFEQGRKRKR
jgi:BlaI family transcriptional regulator, penicillinase repressor